MKTSQYPWAVVIFACRESLPQLQRTLDAALVSAASCAVIHVLVNGNPTLASTLVTELARRDIASTKLGVCPEVQVWSIPLGDKANAWNQYIQRIWAGEAIAFFIDGYVRPNPDAVHLLGQAVTNDPLALGGCGVPTMGRSAKALRENMIINTGFHGNFCCITGETIEKMRDQDIRLPVGLYRTDSLMGAILSYALDPSNHVWEDHRIHVHPTASWQIDPAKWWRMQDLRAFFKRYFRQVRGKLENAAFADHLVNQLRPAAELPPSAQSLVLEWVQRCPDAYHRLSRQQWLVPHALKSLRSAPARASNLTPQRIWPDEAGSNT